MRERLALASIALALLALAASRADADPTAAPTPAPSPTAHGFAVHGDGVADFLTQGASGPGLSPVEGPGFAAGGAAAPVSPYDPFSAAPIAPGNVFQHALGIDAGYAQDAYDVSMRIAAETLIGDRTDEAYWAEPLAPQDDPHVGSTSLGYAIVFPTHPGTDDHDATTLGLTGATLRLHRSGLTLTGGWFDPVESLPHVFALPPLTNAVPGLLLRTPESLNPDTPLWQVWPQPPGLPMRGFRLVNDPSSRIPFEAFDAELPSLPGTPQRITSLSVGGFDQAGHGLEGQLIHARTGGDPISTTTGFGAPSTIDATDQGLFSVSTLFGQHETIAGLKWDASAPFAFDALVEYSHSWYRADGIGQRQTTGGSFAHAALTHALGDASLTAHFYRFEPTFATMILPYGTPEDIWSVAYSWPGPWLKSDFQLVDSSALGVNREGPMLTYARSSGRFQIQASYGDFHQIEPFTRTVQHEPGFVEGFFLVQRPLQATTGSYKRASAYVERDTRFGDVGLDFVDDDLHRGFAPGAPLDAVTYDAPQYVLSYALTVTPRIKLVADDGYFGMRGTWADGSVPNVDFGMRILQAGAEFGGNTASTMITLRRSIMGGTPYAGALHLLRYGSPDFTATTLFVGHAYRF